MIGYVVAAVFIYALAYYCYKKRRIESAGDLLTFGWIKPLFRWGAGICVGYLAAVILSQFLDALMLWISDKIFSVVCTHTRVDGFLYRPDACGKKHFGYLKRNDCWKAWAFCCLCW